MQKLAELEAAQTRMQGTLRGLDEQIGTLRDEVERNAETMDRKAKATDNASAYCIGIMETKVQALHKKAADDSVNFEKLVTEASYCFLSLAFP